MVRCRLVDQADTTSWTSAHRLASVGDGPARLEVHRTAGQDFLLDHASFGRYLVAGDGSSVACAPAIGGAPWRWQRFLTGQVLPLVAVLNGYEVLHASACRVGDGAILFAGPSGAGKSTAALSMLRAGSGFLTDDVAALAHEGDEVYVEPGPGLTSVGSDALDLLSQLRERPGVRELGNWDGEVRLSLPTEAGRARVEALVLLTPSPTATEVGLEPLTADSAPELLGLTYNAYVTDRDRLARQFDLTVRLARQANLVRAVVPRPAEVRMLLDALVPFLREWGGPII